PPTHAHHELHSVPTRRSSDLPREEFVPARRRPLAYIDEDIEIARGRPGRFLMRASPFAKLVQLAGVRPGDLVLDIGCGPGYSSRSEEHTSELQSRENLVCRLL